MLDTLRPLGERHAGGQLQELGIQELSMRELSSLQELSMQELSMQELSSAALPQNHHPLTAPHTPTLPSTTARPTPVGFLWAAHQEGKRLAVSSGGLQGLETRAGFFGQRATKGNDSFFGRPAGTGNRGPVFLPDW